MLTSKLVIAGPCGIESREQAFNIAKFVKDNGANVFRGGAFKGQNHPFVNFKPEYLGLGEEALKILSEIQDMLKIPCATDMQSVEQAQLVKTYDIAYPQVGARNCDSLELLRQFKKIFKDTDKQIILKRGPSSTIDEWIGAAEHLGGPSRVILCERGTVHFDRHDYTRYRLDVVGIAEVKNNHSEYTLIFDPSHGSGNRDLVPILTKALFNITDGVMIEVHYNPDESKTDAPQTIDFETFKKMRWIWGY